MGFWPTVSLFSFVTICALEATTAIGTFKRRLESPTAKEVILRFPVLLSRAYARMQKGRVMYPNEFAQLCEKNGIPRKVLYSPEEYAAIGKFFTGGLITGELYEYTPEEEDEGNSDTSKKADIAENEQQKKDDEEESLIFARIYHYDTQTKKITSFNIYAKPENITFELLRHVLPLEKDRYLLQTVPAQSRIAVFAPLDGHNMNNLLMYMMQLNFDVRIILGTDQELLTPQEFELLREIRTKTVSYTTVAQIPEPVVPPLSAALDNEAERAEYNAFAALYSQKLLGFERSLGVILSQLKQRSGADYLLVLQPFGKTPFARGFDLNRGGLFWLQDSFPVKKSAEPGEIIASMVSEMQRPAKVPDANQLEKIVQEKDRMAAQGTAGGLASVAILDFYDRTNSPLYKWMSTSLSFAVDDSMQRIFEYARANEKLSAETGAKLFRSPADITPKNLQEFQKKTGADYLIFGFYSINPKNGNIVIESKVFDLVKKTAIGGSTTESPVDTRLFNVVDQIAQGIVQDILAMTQRQNQ